MTGLAPDRETFGRALALALASVPERIGEDARAEAGARAWAARLAGRDVPAEPERLARWLTRVAGRVRVDEWRARVRTGGDLLRVAAPEPEEPADPAYLALRERFRAALLRMEGRPGLLLRLLAEGWTVAKAGALAGYASRPAAKEAAKRARRRLAREVPLPVK